MKPIRYVLVSIAVFVGCDASPCLAHSKKENRERITRDHLEGNAYGQ